MLDFLADLTVLVHFTFVVFVTVGGFLVLKWNRLAWVHVPAAIWGIAIELGGWLCPLTHLENWLRHKGGSAGYSESFVTHWVEPVLYPAGLTRNSQLVIALALGIINIAIYAAVWRSQASVNHSTGNSS